jgi:hypothetical protein
VSNRREAWQTVSVQRVLEVVGEFDDSGGASLGLDNPEIDRLDAFASLLEFVETGEIADLAALERELATLRSDRSGRETMPILTPAIRTPSGGRRFEYKLINVARQRKVRAAASARQARGPSTASPGRAGAARRPSAQLRCVAGAAIRHAAARKTCLRPLCGAATLSRQLFFTHMAKEPTATHERSFLLVVSAWQSQRWGRAGA